MKQVYAVDVPLILREDYLLLRATPAELSRLRPECRLIDLEKAEEEEYSLKEIEIKIHV